MKPDMYKARMRLTGAAAWHDAQQANICPYGITDEDGKPMCGRWCEYSPELKFSRKCTYDDLQSCMLVSTQPNIILEWIQWASKRGLLEIGL